MSNKYKLLRFLSNENSALRVGSRGRVVTVSQNSSFSEGPHQHLLDLALVTDTYTKNDSDHAIFRSMNPDVMLSVIVEICNG